MDDSARAGEAVPRPYRSRKAVLRSGGLIWVVRRRVALGTIVGEALPLTHRRPRGVE